MVNTMHQWIISFKKGTSETIQGTSFRYAIILSGLAPFLVVDVESITQIK